MDRRAFGMVAQHFQDLALSDTLAIAFCDHALQLLLESLPAFDPLFDLPELPPRDGAGLGAGLGRLVR